MRGGLCEYLQVTSPLGSAAFSQAVEAIDIKTGAYVCLKVIKVLTSFLQSWDKDTTHLLKMKVDDDSVTGINNKHGNLCFASARRCANLHHLP